MDDIAYVGLIFNCPFGKEDDNCLLKEIIKLEVSERYDEFIKLNSKEFSEIIKHHKNCINRPENKNK